MQEYGAPPEGIAAPGSFMWFWIDLLKLWTSNLFLAQNLSFILQIVSF
jgi:hypothetical protein